MNSRVSRSIVICACAVGTILASDSNAQSWVTDSVCSDDTHSEFHRCALRAARDFDPPRTVDGVPDMQGIWRRRAAMHESLEAHPETIDDNEADVRVTRAQIPGLAEPVLAEVPVASRATCAAACR